MKTTHIIAPLVIGLALAGCVRAPANDLPVQPPGIEPLPTAAEDGLAERKPDLCKAGTYAAYIGQPGSVIPTLGISKAYRVVEYRGIEPQEYNPNRIAFQLDDAGNISGVDCG
ncbi:MAG: I78 family peptidase inhibitor [Paracoccus sp. (in: a-proteobacteria)]